MGHHVAHVALFSQAISMPAIGSRRLHATWMRHGGLIFCLSTWPVPRGA